MKSPPNCKRIFLSIKINYSICFTVAISTNTVGFIPPFFGCPNAPSYIAWLVVAKSYAKKTLMSLGLVRKAADFYFNFSKQ